MTQEEIDKICKDNNYPYELVIITNPLCFPMKTKIVINPETPEEYVKRHNKEINENYISSHS